MAEIIFRPGGTALPVTNNSIILLWLLLLLQSLAMAYGTSSVCLELYVCTHCLTNRSPTLENKWCYSHFTDEEMESQRGKVPCPRSHGWSLAKPGLGQMFQQWCTSLNRYWPCFLPYTRHCASYWIQGCAQYAEAGDLMELLRRGECVRGRMAVRLNQVKLWPIILCIRRYHIP